MCGVLLSAVRLGGWLAPLAFLLFRFPLKTVGGLAFYYLVLSRIPVWKRFVTRFSEAGVDPRFHIIKHGNTDFTKHRFLLCAHPHGMSGTWKQQ